MSEIKDVPQGEVGRVTQDYVDGGSDSVRAIKQDNGKWTVSSE